MYDSLTDLEQVTEKIPADLVSLMLTATTNIARYTGLVERFPYSDLLRKLRYFLNYKYSRFNIDPQTGGIKSATDDYGRYQLFEGIQHFHFTYALEYLQKSLSQNEKLPMFQLIRFSNFLDGQDVSALETDAKQDAKTKYYVQVLWEMLSKLYACDDKPLMLKLVDFWTEQHFYQYSFNMPTLKLEIFELLLNHELLGTVACQANTIYLNKSVMQSNLNYLTAPDRYRLELLKILCNSFLDAEQLMKSIEQCTDNVFERISEEFGGTKASGLCSLLMTEPVITNSSAEIALNISAKTAIGYLKRLEQMKLLKLVRINSKVHYLNSTLIEIVDRY